MSEDLKATARAAIADSVAATDPDYPKLHLAPPVGRLNDPNGLVFWQGEFHACYQFNPCFPERKLTYWGHASSSDLTNWKHHEPAIVPDSEYDRDGAYSGSAIVTDGQAWFAYTGNVRFPDGGRATHQCLVSSPDLRTFTKFQNNPVIPAPPAGYTQHVRDPQVWRDSDGSFRMCLGAQRENLTGTALLYRSPDLLQWHFEGELQFPDAQGTFDDLGYMWECPSLVKVPDQSGALHDVLIFSPQGAEPGREGFENIFPTCYVIGQLVGTSLTNTGDYYELDRGFEFYAPQVFANTPEPMMLAWAGNASEDNQPSLDFGWVHAMSLARELQIRDGRLVQRPKLDLAQAAAVPNPPTPGSHWQAWHAMTGARSWQLRTELDLSSDETWELRIGSAMVFVEISFSATQMVVDRSATRYPKDNRRTVTLPHQGAIPIEIIHDRSITEIFVGDGELSFTMRTYLDPSEAAVWLRSNQRSASGAVVGRRFD